MESLLSSTPLDLLIALDRIDLQDKYREVITRRPRDVPALLRSLYREGKLLDHNALLMSTLDTIYPRGDQLKELLLGGLHNVFVDILTDHTVYATFEVSQRCIFRRDADADARVALHLMLGPTSGLFGKADIWSCRNRASACRRAARSAHGRKSDR